MDPRERLAPPPIRKILVVEDESDIRKFFIFLLESQGFHLETAEDGITGLEAIQWFKPDLVLLNIMMPRMDGLTMLKTLVQNHPPKMPRVIITTGGSATLEEVLSIGAIDLLYYPFTPKVLTQIVREALDSSLDGAQRLIRTKLRHVIHAIKFRGCARAIEEIRRLPLGELSASQRRGLRVVLIEAWQRRLKEFPNTKNEASNHGRRYSGADPTLTALALSEAL